MISIRKMIYSLSCCVAAEYTCMIVNREKWLLFLCGKLIFFLSDYMAQTIIQAMKKKTKIETIGFRRFISKIIVKGVLWTEAVRNHVPQKLCYLFRNQNVWLVRVICIGFKNKWSWCENNLMKNISFAIFFYKIAHLLFYCFFSLQLLDW